MDIVWRAIGTLNVDLKMALLLRDVVGLSYAEIADALETTLATVKWRIYKAREIGRRRAGARGLRPRRPAPAPHRLTALPPVRQAAWPASGQPGGEDRLLRALDVVLDPPPGGRAPVVSSTM